MLLEYRKRSKGDVKEFYKDCGDSTVLVLKYLRVVNELPKEIVYTYRKIQRTLQLQSTRFAHV